MNTSIPKRKTPAINTSILESLRELSGGVGKSVAKDAAGGMVGDAFRSILGGAGQSSGEMKPQQEIGFPAEQEHIPHSYRREQLQKPYIRAEEQDLKLKVDAVRAELKALASSLSALSLDVVKAVQEVPVQPGIYHLNFFDRLLGVLKLIREQIDDSRTWLSMWSQRKQKRSYWRMYKKHGTTFGLSHERTMATQAG